MNQSDLSTSEANRISSFSAIGGTILDTKYIECVLNRYYYYIELVEICFKVGVIYIKKCGSYWKLELQMNVWKQQIMRYQNYIVLYQHPIVFQLGFIILSIVGVDPLRSLFSNFPSVKNVIHDIL